jgi:hypothetical protein
MSDERADLAFRDLVDELDVEPSAAFAAGVRSALRDSAPAANDVLRRFVVALSAAVVVAATAGLWLSSRPSGPAAVPVASKLPTAVAPPSAPAQPANRAIEPAPTVRSSSAHPRVALVRSEVDAPLVASADSRLLVPSDQVIALRRLLRDVRQGWTTVPPELIDRLKTLEPLADPAPVQIPLIRIEPLAAPADATQDRRNQ